MKRAIALACALGALAWAPAAFAGTPFTIGSGTSPHLLVDPTSGDAHVVWLQGPSDGQTVAYCRVPRGARSCAGPVQDLGSPPGGAPDLPHIVRAANGTLYVTQHRYVHDDAYLKESTNGGASFDPAWRPVYSGANWSGPSQPTFHNQGSQLLFPSWNTGLRVYAANISGNQSGDTAEAELPVPAEEIYNFGVGQANATSLVGTADSNENLYLWRLTGGNVNSTASWTQTPELLGEGRESNLASGPRGAYVVSTAGPVGAYRTEVRRITNAGVVGPTVVENTGGTLADLAVGQNGVGVVYRGENRLRFALSTDDSASFSAPYNIAPFDGSAYFSLDVGVANDNQGFAVWNGDAEDNTSIRLTTLEPFVDPPQQPGGGGGNPSGNPGGTQRSQPQSPTQTSTANIPGVPGGRIALQTPRSCVRPGARFNTTLTLQMKRSKTKKKKSGQGRLKVKLSRVDFFIGAKKVKTDKKAPFRQTLRVAQSARPGSTITVRARATIKVKPGSKKRTKSVKTNVSAGVGVC